MASDPKPEKHKPLPPGFEVVDVPLPHEQDQEILPIEVPPEPVPLQGEIQPLITKVEGSDPVE